MFKKYKEKIILIPEKEDILDFISSEIYSEGRNDYSDINLVFPNRCSYIYFQKKFSKKTGRPYIHPLRLTMDDFVSNLVLEHYPDFKKISQEVGAWELFNILVKKSMLLPLDITEGSEGLYFKYTGWFFSIFKFIEKLIINGIDIDSLEKGRDEIESKYIKSLTLDIITVLEEYTNYLKNEKLLDRAMMYFKASRIAKFDNMHPVYFVGTSFLTNSERILAKKILISSNSRLILYGKRERYLYLDNLIKSLDLPVIEVCQYCDKVDSFKEPEELIYSAFDLHSEVKQVYNILNKIEDLSDTAIIVPETRSVPKLMSFAINQLLIKERISDFNVSYPINLRETTIFKLIKSVINLQLNRKTENKTIKYYVKDYLNLLQNLIGNNIGLKIDINKYLQFLIEDIYSGSLINDERTGAKSLFRKTFVTPNELITRISEKRDKRDYPPEIIKKFHHKFIEKFEGISTISGFCGEIQKMIFQLRLGFSDGKYFSGEIFANVNNLIENLKIYPYSNIQFDDNNYKLMLNYIIENLELKIFELTKIKKTDLLEITGLLETRNLRFSNVIVMDIVEGKIPNIKCNDPFIPISAQRTLGLDDALRNKNFAEYNFKRLIAGAEKAFYLYINDFEHIRSRYIEEIVWKKEFEKKKLDIVDIVDIAYEIKPIKLGAEGQISKRGLTGFLEKLVYSQSAISNYLNCPIQFYYRNVMKIPVPIKEFNEIPFTERGIIIHQILQDLFQPYVNKEVNQDNLKKLLSNLDNLNKKYLKGFKLINSIGEYYLLIKIAFESIKRYLEIFFKENQNFMILEVEKRISKDDNIFFEFSKHKVRVTGRIDRIDRVDNQIRIVDYKSGKVDNKKILGDKVDTINDLVGYYFQMPIYIYIYKKLNPDFEIDNIYVEYHSITDKSIARFDNALYEKNEEALKIIFSDIFDESKDFKRRETTNCNYCDYLNVCRFAVYKIDDEYS